MKTFIRHISMILLLFALAPLYGQEKQCDLKRTTEEQAAFEKSIPVNPAKIRSTAVDPKIDPGQNPVGPTNWKPGKSLSDDWKEAVAGRGNSDLQVHSPADEPLHSQPQVEPRGSQVNYRSISSPKTQPAAPEESIINYRSLKGPKTQPVGEKPKR